MGEARQSQKRRPEILVGLNEILSMTSHIHANATVAARVRNLYADQRVDVGKTQRDGSAIGRRWRVRQPVPDDLWMVGMSERTKVIGREEHDHVGKGETGAERNC